MSYDINLIPKNKKILSNKTKRLAILFYALSSILVMLFGLYLPLQEKHNLGFQVKEKEQELTNYTGTQDSYNLLLNQINDITEMDQLLDSIKTKELRATKIMKDIENNIPEKMVVQDITLETGKVTIEGCSDTFTEIAGFIVKLRELEDVSGVSFISAAEDDTSGFSETQSKLSVYHFIVYVTLNVTDPISQLTAENTNGEALQNETNE